jgi:hypothetical protein
LIDGVPRNSRPAPDRLVYRSIVGPVVVNYIREAQLTADVPRDPDTTMYILCAMLAAGLICNYLVKPVASKWYMSSDAVARLRAASASGQRFVRDRQGRT